ncbi:hypothetical protein LBMAG53_00070 [Planctomycetota bacterium]|nr:hypothetical protein LBMAG53_00070 [Planctomycetota bacterium]
MVARPRSTYDDLALPSGRDGWVATYRWTGKPYRRHRHDELELNLAVSGTAVYELDQRRYDLGPGSLIWLFPGQDHQLVSASADCTLWIAVFRSACVRRCAVGPEDQVLLQADPPGHHCRRLASDDARDLTHHLRAVRSVQHDAAALNLGLAFLVRAAWLMFRRAPVQAVADALHPAVAAAVRLIAERPERGGDELAARVGLSRTALSRLFHRELGETIVAYRQRLRVEAFLDQPEGKPEGDLMKAALAAGFGSYAQFHRSVRRVTGVSPREWRAGHRLGHAVPR